MIFPILSHRNPVNAAKPMLLDTPQSVLEQRRHPRVRFDTLLPMKIGHLGEQANAGLENLSLGGLMFRCNLMLSVGETVGCEFRVYNSSVIDVTAAITSRVGNGLYGARFQAGPMSQHLVEEAISDAIARGKASILTIHDLEGGKVMRIVGALTSATKNDFMHALTRVGLYALDLSEVTRIDAEGVSLCDLAVAQYGVRVDKRSECVRLAWQNG